MICSSGNLFRFMSGPFLQSGFQQPLEEKQGVTSTPHVARKSRHSAIDGRTTRHPGYAVSQRRRKRIEEIFGWMKTIGGLRKLRHRGTAKVEWQFLFVAAAYNLVRLRTLMRVPA